MIAAAAELARTVGSWTDPQPVGRVREVTGTVIHVEMRGVSLGDVVEIQLAREALIGQVVGFRGEVVLVIPMGTLGRVAPQAPVRRLPARTTMPVGDELIGRVVDSFGEPLDGGAAPACIEAAALPVAERADVELRFDTGVRAIDGLLTCGRGQRVGVFAGAGCGKSVLVEQIASHAAADVVVVGLVGERGREVRELMGSPRRGRMVIVAATADRSPLERVLRAGGHRDRGVVSRSRSQLRLGHRFSHALRDGAARARGGGGGTTGDQGVSTERVLDAAALARARGATGRRRRGHRVLYRAGRRR
jgi:flagellar biosynthesis/type III secretory pathway ATPase